MRILLIGIALLLSAQAQAMVASCETQGDKVLIVVESRGEKLSREVEVNSPDDFGNQIMASTVCRYAARAVNELRGQGYDYLRCAIRVSPMNGKAELSVQRVDAGMWIWSTGVRGIMNVELNDAAVEKAAICDQVTRYTNTF